MFDILLGKFVDEADPLDTPMRLVLLAVIAMDISATVLAFSVRSQDLSPLAIQIAGAFILFGLVFWVAGPIAIWRDAEVVQEHTSWEPRRGLYAFGSILPGYFGMFAVVYYLLKRRRVVNRNQNQSDDTDDEPE